MSDDEITRSADSKWLSELRAAAKSDEHEDAPLSDDVVPRFAEDLALENDATLAGADIMEQVRQAVAEARPVEPPPIVAPPIVAPPAAAEISDPEKAQRWTPPPRLKPAPTPQLPALLLPESSSRPRRHIVAIAAVVLIAIGALIGGLLTGGDDGSPSPDTAPVSTDVGGTTP